jgi:hypothetical protein
MSIWIVLKFKNVYCYWGDNKEFIRFKKMVWMITDRCALLPNIYIVTNQKKNVLCTKVSSIPMLTLTSIVMNSHTTHNTKEMLNGTTHPNQKV